jgi:adenosylcobinamide-GDP ribazoletransferase
MVLGMTIRQHWQQFLMALMFLTRLPVYPWVQHEPTLHAGISRWFPLVGAVVASIHILLLWALSQLLPWWPAVIISTAFTILFTGAFHEDGFADMCDAFGGGWEKEQVLLIMKDSRLGTYGTLALILMLGSKISLLGSLSFTAAASALMAGHVLSRALSTSLILSLDYVRDTADPALIKTPQFSFSHHDCLLMLAMAAPFFFCLPFNSWLPVIAALAAVRWWAVWYLQQRIGGYTGDCLGAVQQLSELAVLAVFAACT